MSLTFFYHPDRTGGSTAWFWIAKNYSNSRKFLLKDTYHEARMLMQKGSKGKVMNRILIPLIRKRSETKRHFIRAAMNEIDLIVHVHTNNIINFKKCGISLPDNLKPKLIFSIRRPEDQLRSIFRARRYDSKKSNEAFLKRSYQVHFWNTLTYALFSAVKTLSTLQKQSTISQEAFHKCSRLLKSDSKDDNHQAITLLLLLASEFDTIFLEVSRKKDQSLCGSLFPLSTYYALSKCFSSSCLPSYFNQPAIQVGEAKKPLNFLGYDHLERNYHNRNNLDEELYNLSLKIPLPC